GHQNYQVKLSAIAENGLVAYYPFNGNANDESGNGIDGIVSGATLTEDRFGNINNAYKFDGVDDWMNTSTINMTLNEKSMTAWVKLSNTTQKGGGVVSLQVGNEFDSIVYNERDTGWGFGSDYFNRTEWSGVKEDESEWVFVSAVYIDSSYKFYRNGIQILESTSFEANSFSASTNILIGRRHVPRTDNTFLSGVIDEVRLYNRALSESEVKHLFLNSKVDVTLHNLDDDTDITVAVSSSNTSEGTVSPATLTFTEANWDTSQTVTVTGVDDSNTDGHQDYDISLSAIVSVDSSAINFDGVNDYVAVNGLSGKLSTGDDFTISAWFKTDYTPSALHKHILFSAHDSGSGNTFRVGTGVYGGIYLNHAVVDKEYGSGFNDNNWHFVSVVITGTGVPTVRVDGNIISGFPNGQTSWSSATRYSIGQEWDSSSASDFWNGFIDEVAIWKAALSSEEVTALYNSGNGLNASSNSGSYNNSANLIAYWQFNEGSGTVSHPTQGDPTLNGTLNGILSSNWSSDDGLHIPRSEKTQVGLHNLDDDTDVTVAVSSSNTSEGTVSPATLTFTEANWDTAQTVTVTGVDDNNS
ncbi:MAG TPA: hypothetical protein EYP92_09485, partial [Candidatus Thioglobus sp.]|nr:hypothetical protein [Candidatus Thioglobus sp.]